MSRRRRLELERRISEVGTALRRLGIAPSGSQIQPVIVGADGAAMEFAAAMQARGFDVRAVRPPTVPEGTARLRIALTLNVDDVDTRRMVEALGDVARSVPLAVAAEGEQRETAIAGSRA